MSVVPRPVSERQAARHCPLAWQSYQSHDGDGCENVKAMMTMRKETCGDVDVETETEEGLGLASVVRGSRVCLCWSQHVATTLREEPQLRAVVAPPFPAGEEAASMCRERSLLASLPLAPLLLAPVDWAAGAATRWTGMTMTLQRLLPEADRTRR